MSIKIARIGDAISHGGQITSASSDTYGNSRQMARLGDTVICHEHGTQSIVTASDNLFCNGIPVARIGDSISCGATIIEGSENINN